MFVVCESAPTGTPAADESGPTRPRRTAWLRVGVARALGVGLALCCLCLPSAGCDDDPLRPVPEPRPEPEPEPEPEVLLPVGYLEATVTYRPPGLTAGVPDREVPLRVWFPAAEGSGTPLEMYGIGDIVEVPTDIAFADASPASGQYPVMLYSHGNFGEALIGYPYAERFAQKGWVVVAPTHVGNSVIDRVAGNEAPFAQSFLYRVLDLEAAADWLEAPTADVLAGVADTSQMFVIGHSFGGATTLTFAGAPLSVAAFNQRCTDAGDTDSCSFLARDGVAEAFEAVSGDPRVKGIAPQAPAALPLFADPGLSDIPVPAVLMTARRDMTTTQEESAVPAWNQLGRAGDIWVEMPDGGHFSFISTCFDLTTFERGIFQPGDNEDGCGPDFLPPEQALAGLIEYALSYAELVVLGDASAGDDFDVELEGFVITRP